MASLGNKFQTAREARGLTLEQMVSRTRIQASYLRALESDSLDQLPERVFAKGFIRAYARSLELDEEGCLRLFEEGSASFYQKEKEGEGIRKRSMGLQGIQKERASRAMVVLLVGGLLLLGGIVLLQQQSPLRSASSWFSQRPVESRDKVASKPGPANEVDSQPSSVEPPFDASIVSTTGSENDPLVLEIRTLEMTWAVIRSDEDQSQEVLLRTGEVIRRQARDRFLLTLGNAGGVEVRLNGQLQGPFGESGVVVRDVELRPSRSLGILDRENPH